MAGQRFAVLIGNSVFPEDMERLSPLRCPARDVRALAELLNSDRHGPYVTAPIIDTTHDVGRRAIYRCLKNAKRDDLVLIYYSGHGKLDEEGNLYLAMRDTETETLPPTSIPVEDIRRYISESIASSVVIVLDCCFSGSIKKMYKGEISDQAIQAIRCLEGGGRFFLTAGTDTQLAEEKEGDEYSLLTKYIIEGIRDGSADINDDGRVSFQELCSFVQNKVPTEGKQRPKAWFLDAAGDVTIALTGRPASATRRKAVTKKLYEMASKEFVADWNVAALLQIINPMSNDVESLAKSKEWIDGFHSKLSNEGEFVQEITRRTSEMRHLPQQVQPSQDNFEQKPSVKLEEKLPSKSQEKPPTKADEKPPAESVEKPTPQPIGHSDTVRIVEKLSVQSIPTENSSTSEGTTAGILLAKYAGLVVLLSFVFTIAWNAILPEDSRWRSPSFAVFGTCVLLMMWLTKFRKWYVTRFFCWGLVGLLILGTMFRMFASEWEVTGNAFSLWFVSAAVFSVIWLGVCFFADWTIRGSPNGQSITKAATLTMLMSGLSGVLASGIALRIATTVDYALYGVPVKAWFTIDILLCIFTVCSTWFLFWRLSVRRVLMFVAVAGASAYGFTVAYVAYSKSVGGHSLYHNFYKTPWETSNHFALVGISVALFFSFPVVAIKAYRNRKAALRETGTANFPVP
jgi:hypothetical protein